MPVRATQRARQRVAKRAGRRITRAAAAVRQHWSTQEAERRHAMAEQMQHRLVAALGLLPAPVQPHR